MAQSNFIFGALAVAFLIFVTIRGSLPKYLEVIFGGDSDSGAAGEQVARETYGNGPQLPQDALNAMGGMLGRPN